jgi:hypothetical protein
MTRPDPGSVFHLSPNLPVSAQQIEVGARPTGETTVIEVTLYVDGVPLQSLRVPPYRAFWILEPGEHVFMARGYTADGQLVESDVVRILVRED